MKVFFFIKYFQEDFKKYFQKITESDAIFTFDLEDSLLDFESEELTAKIKQKYRTILKELLSQNDLSYQNTPLAIRINHPSSEEFIKDVNLLKSLKGIIWQTILIPKIDSVKDIIYMLNSFHENEIEFHEIGVFIETESGILALSDIVSQNIKELKYVIFGHADYNLDVGMFPFIHQQEQEYWHWVNRILTQLKGSSITFINSPCLFLSNDSLFKFNLSKLIEACKHNYGQMTLNLKQTIMCNKYIHDPENEIMIPLTKQVDKHEFAVHISRLSNTDSSEKSFSIDADQYLVSPHEILAAKSFLKTHKY